MKILKAARITRVIYSRVYRRVKGVPDGSSRGGHNKKLVEPKDRALKDYLLMCFHIGRSAGLDNLIAAGNSILRYQGTDTTVSCKWGKRWIGRNHDFWKNLREKPMDTKRRDTHKREDIEEHFKEFRRCKEK